MLVRAGIEIQDVKVALPHMRDHPRQKGFKPGRVKGLVHLAPVHAVAGNRIPHREFISWGTPCSRAGESHQGAVVRQAGFAPGNRRFH